MYPSLWVSKPQGIQTDPSEIFISSITVINVHLLHQEQVVHARHSCLSIYLEVYQRHPAPFSSSEQYHISKTIQKKKKQWQTERDRRWIPWTWCQLTARSCLTNMSEAFSEMFPTNTVVVGPAFSSASFTLMGPDSLFWIIGFCAAAIAAGSRTWNITL